MTSVWKFVIVSIRIAEMQLKTHQSVNKLPVSSTWEHKHLPILVTNTHLCSNNRLLLEQHFSQVVINVLFLFVFLLFGSSSAFFTPSGHNSSCVPVFYFSCCLCRPGQVPTSIESYRHTRPTFRIQPQLAPSLASTEVDNVLSQQPLE